MSTVYRLVVPRANAPHDLCLLHHRLQGCLTTAVSLVRSGFALG